MKTLLPLFVSLYFLVGCLSSTEPFFSEDSKVQDDRILGDYSNPDGSMLVKVSRVQGDESRYTVRLELEAGVMILAGTLFELDDALYIDLAFESSDFAEGSSATVPGPVDLLNRIFTPGRHALFGVRIEEDSLEFLVSDPPTLRKFNKAYLHHLDSIELMRRIEIKEDRIHVVGDPKPLLPVIAEAVQKKALFQNVGVLDKASEDE